MTLIYILGGVSIALAMASGYFSVTKKTFNRLVVKTLASALFMIVGFIALLLKSEKGSPIEVFDVLIMVSLLLGLLGDIFLCMNAFDGSKHGKQMNLFGVVTFALGHLTYVINFLINAGNFTWWTLALFVVIPVMMVIMVKAKFLATSKKMIAILSGYGVILSLMFVSSVNFYLNVGGLKGLFVLIAGVIFTTSDCSLLVRDYSIAEKLKKPLKFYVLLTYYVAQLLFAVAMMY